MKKALSVLLMVAMLVSLSAAALAAPSPTQDDAGTVVVPAGKPAKKDPKIAAVEIVAEDDIVFAEDCDGAVGTDALDDADAATQDAVNALNEMQKDAVNALTPAKLTKALAVGNKALLEKVDGKTAVCTNPQVIWSKTGEYPILIVYTVDHPIDTVMLCYDGGTWEVPADLEIVDNHDGTWTVSFTLEAPAFYTDISFK